MTQLVLLRAAGASAPRGPQIPLDLAPVLPHRGRYDEICVHVCGLPAGAALSAGRNNGDQSWTLRPQDVHGLVYLPGRRDFRRHALVVRLIGLIGADEGDSLGSFCLTIDADGRTPALPDLAFAGIARVVPDFNELRVGRGDKGGWPPADEHEAADNTVARHISLLNARLAAMEREVERLAYNLKAPLATGRRISQPAA